MRPAFRADRVLDEVASVARSPSPRHRGGRPPDRTAITLAIGVLADRGEIVRDGRMLRLPRHEAAMGPEMQQRVDALLDGLREAGAAPPRVDGIATRLGIPLPLVQQLRDSGQLVAVAPGIDYPSDTWLELDRRIADLAGRGPLNVARVRDGLRTTRRHAEALLAYRRARRASARDRRGVR